MLGFLTTTVQPASSKNTWTPEPRAHETATANDYPGLLLFQGCWPILRSATWNAGMMGWWNVKRLNAWHDFLQFETFSREKAPFQPLLCTKGPQAKTTSGALYQWYLQFHCFHLSEWNLAALWIYRHTLCILTWSHPPYPVPPCPLQDVSEVLFHTLWWL